MDFIVSEPLKENVETFSKQTSWATHDVLKEKPFEEFSSTKEQEKKQLIFYLETQYKDVFFPPLIMLLGRYQVLKHD